MSSKHTTKKGTKKKTTSPSAIKQKQKTAEEKELESKLKQAQSSVYNRVHNGRRGFMWKGRLDVAVHTEIIDLFCDIGHDYTAIASASKYFTPESIIRQHVKECLIYLHISGYELPLTAYPLPFNLNDELTIAFLTAHIAKLREIVARDKKSGHPFFIFIPNRYEVDSVYYRNSLSILSASKLTTEFIKALQQKGMMSLSDVYDLGLSSSSTYRSDTTKQAIDKHEVIKYLIKYFKPKKAVYVVPIRLDQDHYNTRLHKLINANVSIAPSDVTDESDTVSRKWINDVRVKHLIKILSDGRWNNTFKLQRLEDDLFNMNQTNKRQFRYSEQTKIYAHCLLNNLGERKYQMILGMKERTSDTGEYDPRRVNDILPSVSLLQQQRLPMITHVGVFDKYIQLCSELVKRLDTFDNMWVLMVDSVDLQANLTVCRQKGVVYGISGRVYNISDVSTEQIFKELDAHKHLARKATVVLLCHTSDQFAIPAAYTTCVSETTDGVSTLFRNTMNSCIKHGVNVQLLNSDGANYSAVKGIANEFKIGAVNCACHLGKNVRNPLLQDIQHNRTLLIPVHTIDILQDKTGGDLHHTKCRQEHVNFITVDIDDITDKFELQIAVPIRGGRSVLFEGTFFAHSCDLYFSDNYQSSYIFSKDKSKASLSIYSLEKKLDDLVFRCSNTTARINCTGYVVQKVSMDSVRATYENDLEVQKLMSWEGMHCTDKMKESFMADLCSDKYLDLLKTKYPQYPGIHTYLTIMNSIYHPSASNKPLEEVLTKYETALGEIEKMRDLMKNFDGLYGVTDATYDSLVLCIAGCKHLKQYLANNPRSDGNPISFSSRLLLTNRLEGLFGRCRLMMRRFTHFQFQMIISKLVTECLLFLNPERKHSMIYGKKSHYMEFMHDQKNKSTENREDISDIVKNMLNAFTSSQKVSSQAEFTDNDCKEAICLAEKFHMPKVKVLRDSYYGPRLNDLNKLIQTRNKPMPLDATVTQSLSNYSTSSSQMIQLEDQTPIEMGASIKQLFKRPDHELPQTDTAIVWTDFEWNYSSQIISIGAYHHESDMKFQTLVKQRTVGKTDIHGITLSMLENAPSLLNALKEYVAFLRVLNAKKILLLAHFGRGADFPKLFRAIHKLGLNIGLDIQLSDTRYVFVKLVDAPKSGKKASLKLPALYEKCFPDRNMYKVHDSLEDCIALREVFVSMAKIDHDDVDAVHKYIMSFQTKSALDQYEHLVSGRPVARRKRKQAPTNGAKRRKRAKRAKHAPDIDTSSDSNDEFEETEFVCDTDSDDDTTSDTRRSGVTTRRKSRQEQFEMEHSDVCEECGTDGTLYMCDTCTGSYCSEHAIPVPHPDPDEDWFCMHCIHDLESNCSVCSKPGIDLIACDSCSTKFHPACCDRGSTSDDWYCNECIQERYYMFDMFDSDDEEIDDDPSDDYDGTSPMF